LKGRGAPGPASSERAGVPPRARSGVPPR
jgi:hypothetical protein